MRVLVDRFRPSYVERSPHEISFAPPLLLLGSLLAFVAALPPLVACQKGSSVADAATPPLLVASGETSSSADASPPVGVHQEILSAAECNRLIDRAYGVLAQTRARDPGGCKSHTDCVLTSEAPCGTHRDPVSVTKTYKPILDAARAKVDASECKDWHGGGCVTTTPIPIPSQRPHWPTCERGRCVASRTAPP